MVAGCANVHEVLNHPVATTVAPGLTNSIKSTFYADRYDTIDPSKMVPTAFANTAGDKLGEDYVFIGFNSKPNKNLTTTDVQYQANYYKPVVATGDKVMVEQAFFNRFPERTKSNKEYISGVIYLEYNCPQQTATIKALKAYSGRNLDGVLVSDTKLSPKEQVKFEILPKTIDAKIYSKVCVQNR